MVMKIVETNYNIGHLHKVERIMTKFLVLLCVKKAEQVLYLKHIKRAIMVMYSVFLAKVLM